MSEFINTADVIGDDEMCDQIIQRTVTEYKDNRVMNVGDYAFYNCKSLTEVDLPSVTTIGKYAFGNCRKIHKISLPAVTELVSYSSPFSGVYATILDLPNLRKLGHETMYNTGIKAIVIRQADSVPTAQGSLGSNSLGLKYAACHVYVPAALLDSYKAATNWSSYADKIRSLEDYTVDGTVTGELDETKI